MTLAWPQIDVKMTWKICFEIVTIPTKFQVHTEIILIWPQNMNPGLPHQMIPVIMSKISFEMVTIPTKFQVQTKVYTNMTSDDPWMTLKILSQNLAWNGDYTHQVSSSYNSLYSYDLIWPLDDIGWPSKYRQKICLEIWPLDDLENTVRKFVLKWSLYLPSFKSIWKFMTSDDPWMTLKTASTNVPLNL